VSQCQIKNFFNKTEEKIYLFDKRLNNFFYKPTTKTVFSETDSNSKLVDGVVDHSILEDDLKNNFEDEFTQCFNQIETAIQGSQIITPDLHEALIKLTRYGLAGEIRPPQHKLMVDQALFKPLFEQILPNAAPELKKQLEELKENLAQTKYSNSILYSDFANTVLELMGEVFFEIYYISGDGIFILPDRPSFTQREKINQYFNPDIKEIAVVQIPLSSKVMLHVESKKLRDGHNQFIELTNKDNEYIDKVNISMLIMSYKQVACESKEYLESLLNKVRS
jgi:hypothetical protein